MYFAEKNDMFGGLIELKMVPNGDCIGSRPSGTIFEFVFWPGKKEMICAFSREAPTF